MDAGTRKCKESKQAKDRFEAAFWRLMAPSHERRAAAGRIGG